METKRRFSEKMLSFVVLSFALIMASAFGEVSGTQAMAADDDSRYTSDFRLEDCTFETVGANAYFVLTPGFYWAQAELHNEGGGISVVGGGGISTYTYVTDETQSITLPGIGTIQTRVVEESEMADGAVKEVSRNLFAICKETGDIYYFGEDVDNYDAGQVISHEGTWRAGENGARPGIIMPGTFLLGSRYFQEMAPGVAMDRAENVMMGIGGNTAAGTFDNCVGVLETSSIEPNLSDYKFYCPGIGQVAETDGDSLIVLYSYGITDCGAAGCGYWDY